MYNIPVFCVVQNSCFLMLYKIPVLNDVQYSCKRCCTLVCFALICCIKVWMYIILVGVLYLILMYTSIATRYREMQIFTDADADIPYKHYPNADEKGGRAKGDYFSSYLASLPSLVSLAGHRHASKQASPHFGTNVRLPRRKNRRRMSRRGCFS